MAQWDRLRDKVTAWHRGRLPAVPVGPYTAWTWPPSPSGYREMRWEVEPRTDPSPVGYFWSHQVAIVGGEAAYFGLQTMGSEPTGKIAIFSVWGASDADGPDYAAPFSGEGSGMSVRIRFQWEVGRRAQLSIRAERAGWWRAEVEGRPVGRIRVDSAWGGLAANSIMWTERYAPPLPRCAEMGHAAVWFSPPIADEDVIPLRHDSYLATHRGCPGSSVTDADGGVLQVMGAAD